MKLNEIQDVDKIILKLRGVRYDFEENYNLVNDVCRYMPPSAYRSLLLKSNLSAVENGIRLLLDEGFDITDQDVSRCNEIYEFIKTIK